MKSINLKLIIWVISIFIVANALTIWSAYRISTRELQVSVNSDLTNLARATAAEIHNINDRELKMLESLAKLPQIRDESVDMHDKWAMMNAISKGDSNYFGMAIYNEKGIGWTTTEKYQDLHEREYLAESIKGKIWVQDPNWSPVNGNLSTFYAHPVYNAGGKQIAEVVAVVDSLKLCEEVSSLVIGKNSHPVVINMETGQYVAASDAEIVKEGQFFTDNQSPELQPIIKRICAGESDVAAYFDTELNAKMAIGFTPVGGSSRWAVVCIAPYGDFFGGLTSLLGILATIFVVGSIFMALVCTVVISMTIKPLKALGSSIQSIASGSADLTKRIEQTSSDEIGSVVSGFNQFSEKLQSIISGIKHSNQNLSETGDVLKRATQEATDAVTRILENITDVSDLIAQRTSGFEDIADTSSQMAANINELDSMISEQTRAYNQAASSVEEMIRNITSVNEAMEKMGQTFSELMTNAQSGSEKQKDVSVRIEDIEKQSEMLHEANQVIASIAEQTNLLAMNAAIEAAHAGEAGKGFSVVADEIRKLSETSSNQSRNIGNQLSKISESIKEVVMVSHESSAAFNDLAAKIRATDPVVQKVRIVMEEQNHESKQIDQAIKAVNNSMSLVHNASLEMTEGHKQVMENMGFLQKAAVNMESSMNQMTLNAKKVNDTSSSLKTISEKMHDSITEIGSQIDQFKV